MGNVVDETIHQLQALVHASRRLILQECGHTANKLGSQEQAHLQSTMRQLIASAQHLHEHLTSTGTLDNDTKAEILDHMLSFEEDFNQVHAEIESPRVSRSRRWGMQLPVRGIGSPRHSVRIEDNDEGIAFSFVMAVCIDAFVDGFLVGLSFIAKPSAGLVMAGATCIEMGFLGINFAGSLRRATANTAQTLFICALPLILLVVGGLAAGTLCKFVYPGSPVFEGLVSFCVVALLFLVTQELLTQANENLEGKEIIWVNIMIFVGIGIVMATEVVITSIFG